MIIHNKLLTVNKSFVKQAFYATLFVSILMVLASFRYQSFEITVGLIIGIMVSLCSSFVLWQWINYIISDLKPGAVPVTKPSPAIKSVAFALMGIGKIFVLGLVFFLIFKFLSINIIALFIGLSVVQLVVLSMIVSIVLVDMLNNVRGADYMTRQSRPPEQRPPDKSVLAGTGNRAGSHPARFKSLKYQGFVQ